jgi:spore coat-associated protein N
MNARTSRRTGVRLTLLTAAGALVAVGLLHDGVLLSAARMTDTASTTAASVATGSVSLALSNGASASSWTGAVSLKPGDTVYKRITVTNDGTSRLRYAVTATSSSALSAKLVMNVAVITASSACTSTTYAAGTVVSGTDLPFGATTALAVVGDPATGAQSGDRVLAASAADNLCLRLALPTGTGMGYAGRGTTATTTFAFSGENA